MSLISQFTSFMRKPPPSVRARTSKATTSKVPIKPPAKPSHSKTLKSKEPSLREKETIRKQKSAKIIQSFMKETTLKRRERFLEAICSDSGVCLAFGQERDKLIKYFGFKNFAYFTGEFKDIGNPSTNGFVKELTYKRNNYYAHAVLKVTKGKSLDNLAYEYMVGMYVNKLAKQVPCFIETYGLFGLAGVNTRYELEKYNLLRRPLIRVEPNNLRIICKHTSLLCVLIQNLKDAKTFGELENSMEFWQNEAMYLFYQVYFALNLFREVFTHYDLHANNVLLYEPVDGGYIQYHYYGKKKVEFKSKYIAKIIDYGRCFFKGSKKYFDEICKEQACHPCGAENKHGFDNLFTDRTKDSSNFNVNSLYKNESHDLRFVNSFKNYNINKNFNKIFDNIVYGVGLPYEERYFGTKEDLSSLGITSVRDAEQAFRGLIQLPENKIHNDKVYDGLHKIGDIHVYSNGRPMSYVPVKKQTISL